MLPACVHAAMPKLAQLGVSAPQRRLAVILGMPLLLLLLGSGIAGQAVWRRRRLQWVAAGGRRHGRQDLPHAWQQQQQPSHALQLATESHAAFRAAEAGRDPQLRMRRQARLAAWLREELGSQQYRGIEMLPLDAQPAALAHQLGSLRKTAVAGGAGATAATVAAASAAARAAYVANGVPEEAQHLLGPQQAADVLPLPGLAAAVTSRAGGGPRPAAAPISRQWRLPTKSLQVSPNQLEVRFARQTGQGRRSVVDAMWPAHAPCFCSFCC